MRKLLSIALTAILVLHVLGYNALFLGAYYKNNAAMMRAFDSNRYDQSRTLTIKVAVSIPYMPDQSGFERVDGKFVHNGKHYRVIKQRYARDTLTVVCLRDTELPKIDKALASYVNTFTDKATTTKHTTKISVNFLNDYLPAAFSIRPLATGWAANLVHNTSGVTFIPSYTVSIIHPPERT